MTGKKSRDKGQRGEREAANELVRLFQVEAHRGRQYCGGQDSPDIKTTIPKVHFEVKRTECLSLYAAMDQAEGDAGIDIPVVLHRRNNKDWLAIVALDDLPGLVKILSKLLKEGE